MVKWDSILSCDWGTSSFRLKLVTVAGHEIVGALNSGDGIALIHDRWKAAGGFQGVAREAFYLKQLQESIHVLSDKLMTPLSGIPVLVSGMASSSIGIRELPYASLPFSTDGANAAVQELPAGKDFPHALWMILGICSQRDIMRGEETQLIGLASLDNKMFPGEGAVCIFPGTHSKHILVENGKVVDFKTYMTGELFQLMIHHSILKDAIDEDNRQGLPAGSETGAFRLGIEESGTSNLLHNFFSIRVNHLFGRSTKWENLFHLSGLLIGSELRSLMNEGRSRILLCSGSNMYQLYKLGMEILGLQKQAVFIGPELMDRAAMEGQLKVFQNRMT
jgi:2-dehydro-3-deoxygalactonokinase